MSLQHHPVGGRPCHSSVCFHAWSGRCADACAHRCTPCQHRRQSTRDSPLARLRRGLRGSSPPAPNPRISSAVLIPSARLRNLAASTSSRPVRRPSLSRR